MLSRLTCTPFQVTKHQIFGIFLVFIFLLNSGAAQKHNLQYIYSCSSDFNLHTHLPPLFLLLSLFYSFPLLSFLPLTYSFFLSSLTLLSPISLLLSLVFLLSLISYQSHLSLISCLLLLLLKILYSFSNPLNFLYSLFPIPLFSSLSSLFPMSFFSSLL